MLRPLLEQVPWASSPLIVNAPMGGFAGGALAAAVTQAGGVGMIGGVMVPEIDKELNIAAKALGNATTGPAKTLPVGIGLLPFALRLESVLPVLEKYNPAVVWLFAAKELGDYAEWTTQIKKVCPQSAVWIQVGSVTAALTVAQSAKPDALIMQGADAGGHGFERGASIVSLLPEASDVLKANRLGSLPLLASGGIVDARGAAGAFALGAAGVVMGTRFLAAKQTIVPAGYRELVLAAKDGGQATVRSKLFDNVKQPTIWPEPYDGRSLVTNSYIDHVQGVSIQEIRDKHNKAVVGEDLGFGRKDIRANVWVGASVGLVNDIENAADIVEEVRSGTRQALEKAMTSL